MNQIQTNYEIAKKLYKDMGIDTDEALKVLQDIKISVQCWQGDDVTGFLNKNDLSGGIAVTGNYPNKARNIKELRDDLDFAMGLIPGKHKVNLHAIYLDSSDKVDLNEIEPKHFETWVSWAKDKGYGLDFNPTCFSHTHAKTGFTLSSNDYKTSSFWIEHCKRCRRIGAYFGKELNQTSVVNIWIPDGFKDEPYDDLSPRIRLEKALDEIYSEKYDEKLIIDSVESKLFGIGAESYTTGSHEFYLGYAIKNNKAVCLDSGHFHPTETISDKLSAVSLFVDNILLHVSRPVRWDSDHIVTYNDDLNKITNRIIRNDLLKKVSIGMDYFDASINRVAAWVIGARNIQKALLRALLEPKDYLKQVENKMNYTDRLAILEELKTKPFGMVYDYFCYINQVPSGVNWLDDVKQYEKGLKRV